MHAISLSLLWMPTISHIRGNMVLVKSIYKLQQSQYLLNSSKIQSLKKVKSWLASEQQLWKPN